MAAAAVHAGFNAANNAGGPRWGLVVLAGMALARILWSVTVGGTSGAATVVPALTGLLVGAAAITVVVRRRDAPRHSSRSS